MTVLGTGVAEGAVGATLDGLGEVGLLDLGEAGGDGLLDTEDGTDALGGLGGLLVLGAVGGLGLAGLAGEEDQAGLVGLETLDVDGEALLGQVGAAVVNRDADGGGILLGDASGLFCGSSCQRCCRCSGPSQPGLQPGPGACRLEIVP